MCVVVDLAVGLLRLADPGDIGGSDPRGELRFLITPAFEDSEQTYGYRRVRAELGRCG